MIDSLLLWKICLYITNNDEIHKGIACNLRAGRHCRSIEFVYDKGSRRLMQSGIMIDDGCLDKRKETAMAKVARFGVSIEEDLLKRFDRRNRKKGYANRSEAIRDLIRDGLVEDACRGGRGEHIAVVSIVYDHHKLALPKKLVDHQHEQHSVIVVSTHVHLDAHNCLEVVILRGKAKDVRAFAEVLVSTRGVKHGKYFMTTGD